jgi:hypothetical protein
MNSISKGCIIGVKGRAQWINKQMRLIGEKVQIF